jgi:hypothetical protein
MTKEKMQTLSKYVEDCQNKLAAPIPEKQKKRETQYREYLRREISQTKAQLDAAKMEGPSAAKPSAPSK